MSLQFAGARELRDVLFGQNGEAGSCTTTARRLRKMDRRSAEPLQVSNTSITLIPS